MQEQVNEAVATEVSQTQPLDSNAIKKMQKNLAKTIPNKMKKKYQKGMLSGTFVEACQPYKAEVKPGRNEKCSCGSGLKFKKCCGK